jgi:DNA-binding transcriptional LysR family regulator
VEVGSLALAIAMVRRAPLCTILPASSVRQDIEAGDLVAVPINQEELSGALSLIFSVERELSEAERAIVQEFIRVFRPRRGNSRTERTEN